MFPTINKRETGLNLRRIMDSRGFTVRDVQRYLSLGSVQSVYHWLNGVSMPTIDNLYALSDLFRIPVDDMVRGNRRRFLDLEQERQYGRLSAYYAGLDGKYAA